MHLAVSDAELAFDECPHPFGRPKIGAESVGVGALAQGRIEPVEGGRVQPAGTARSPHGTQTVHTAVIEHPLPGIYRLPGHTDRLRHLGNRFAQTQ